MINLVIWLFVVNFLAFFISKSRYSSPLRKKLDRLSTGEYNKLQQSYYLLYLICCCSYCLSFWMGIFILSTFAEPTKTLFGVDFFFNFILDGIFSLILNISLLVIYGLTQKIYKFIKNKKNG